VPRQSKRVRLATRERNRWLELGRLPPPAGPETDDFWGQLTLHVPGESLSAYVGWNPAHQKDVVAFFDELARSQDGWDGAKELRTQDDDLRLECFHDGTDVVAQTRVLDWWDPYHGRRNRPYQARELQAELRLDPQTLPHLASAVREVLIR
jgi:hypothetical protein